MSDRSENDRESFVVADRLFDGFEVHEGVAVGIRGGVVSRVVPARDVPSEADCRRLSGTMTPGLIDAHVHMAPWMVFGLIAAGVTTVRDLGNDLDTIQALLAALPPSPQPNVVWSGPLLETQPTNWPPIALGHATPDDIRASIDSLHARGILGIKLYHNITRDFMVAAAERAHEHGMRVVAHLGLTSLRDAVEAGVDEIQHLSGATASDQGLTDWAEAARVAASYDIDHCVTLKVWDSLAHMGEPRARRDAAMQWMHPQALEGWNQSNQVTQTAEARARRLTRVLEHKMAIRPLLDAGRGILVGSDAPNPGLIPGFSLHDEAGMLEQAGMDSLQVMQAMTSGNAQRIGSPAGRLVAGAPADIAVFPGNPAARVTDLVAPTAVWRVGVEVDLDELTRVAAQVFSQNTRSPQDRIAEWHYTPAAIP